MQKNTIRLRNGFTLVELMVTMVAAFIIVLGIGAFIVNIQRGWGQMFTRVHGDIVQDGYIARKAFDGTVRKAARHYTISDDATGVEVDYWNDTANNDAIMPDRYARFYCANNQLLVEYGINNPRTEIRTDLLASSVSSCSFAGAGTSLKMNLLLDNGRQNLRVVTSAVLHN
ncbi:MAG: prepilin-type N-terminal cleavage/methylation domain-containing protein [Gammaproteobacteria bacterium]